MTRTARATLGLAVLSSFLFLCPDAMAQAPKPADVHGDALPDGAVTRLGTVRLRHGPVGVNFVAYLADGARAAVLAQDGKVRIWDTATGQEVRTLEIANAGVLAASPDGKTLATATHDGSLIVWEAATGSKLQAWRASTPQGVGLLAFAPDGKRLLTRENNNALRLWDAATGKELLSFSGSAADPQRGVYSVGPQVGLGFLEGGKVVATGAMSFENNRVVTRLRRWQVETGKELPALDGPPNGLSALAFAPDGKSAAWGYNDGTVRIIDAETGKELKKLGGGPQSLSPNALAYSPDGMALAVRGRDQSLRLFDAETGKELRRLSAPVVFVHHIYQAYSSSTLAFAPDGKRLASGNNNGALRQWEAATGKEVEVTAGHTGSVLGVAFAADGKAVATRGTDGTVRLWDAADGKPLGRLALADTATAAAFSAGGKTAVAAGNDGVVRLYDVAAGKELRQWTASAEARPGLTALALSPDGKVVATRGGEPVIRLWDAGSGKQLRQFSEVVPGPNGTPGFVGYHGGLTMLFSPDGTVLATVAADNFGLERRRRALEMAMNTSLRLWDVATGKPLRVIESNQVRIASFAFTPDGRTVATSTYDNNLTLWETATGKLRFQFRPAVPSPLAVLAFAPDGRTLAGATQQYPESAVRFWDALTGKELPPQFKGHRGMIAALAFAPDGKRLVTGGHDTTALVWDTAALRRPAETTELTAEKGDALWADLASADAKKAFEAVRVLAQAPGQTPALMAARLKAVPGVEAERLAGLIADLDSNVFTVRQKATAELEKLGELAEPELLRVLDGKPALETRQRVERLLERLAGAAVPPEELRALRALEALEMLGTAEALAVVKEVAKGAAGSRVTRGAKATLARLAE